MNSGHLPDKRFCAVHGLRMAYVETARQSADRTPSGQPAAADAVTTIVFLHGNPTSSYLWRNVMPHVADLGRCIAPDLIGMGDSARLPDAGAASDTFVEHRRYLDGLLDALGVHERVVLVLHDWGSALGFDWANRHRGAVRGICYMEAIVRPLLWREWPATATPVFQGFRSPAGEDMVLAKNVFIERVLPGSILRELSAAEMAEYRRAFLAAGEGRRPMLAWPRQLPLEGEPADVVAIVQAYADWLTVAGCPKLFINADPGAILVGA